MKLTKRFALLSLVCLILSTQADTQSVLQQNHIKLSSQINDTAKVNALNYLAKYHINADQDSAQFYVNKALILSEMLHYKRGIGMAQLSLGVLESDLGNFPEALDYILKATAIAEEIKDYTLLAGCKLNLGNFYIRNHDFDRALEVYAEGISIAKKNNAIHAEASLLTSYGMGLRQKGELDSALIYYEKVLELQYSTLHDSVVIAAIYNNMAAIHFGKGDIQTAENYLLESYKINQIKGNQRYMLMNLSNLGELNGMPGGDFNKSVAYYEESIKMATKMRAKEALETIYFGMSRVYFNQGKYKEAYKFLTTSLAYKDSIYGEGKQTQIREISEEFKTRQIQDSLTIKQKELELSRSNELAAELKTSKVTWQLLGSGILMVAILIALLALFRHSKNQKKINRLLHQKNEEINSQKHEIEEKNIEITDSINYAKRIQHAILPSSSYLTNVLGEYFLIFKPKDIVSGDFYWVKYQNNKRYFAVADCTGHGVPGAMVSMLGFETIERVSNADIDDASVFVNHINEALVKSLTSKSTDPISKENQVKDGMDLSFCILSDQKKLSYCGANNECYVVRKKGNSMPEETNQIKLTTGTDYTVIELKPTKRPVGVFESDYEFNSIELQLETGDMIYLFTDGYADQFGGSKGKKMKTSNFRERILEAAHMSMQDQSMFLQNFLYEWQQNFDQLDDITVLGIKIS